MKGKQKKADPRTAAEKVSLSISLIVLALVVGLVLYLWLSSKDKPALIRIERETARYENQEFYLPVTVINRGGAAATDVMIEGSLEGESEKEVATITFDFIPASSQAEGILVFTGDPASARLRLVSFRIP